jgi:hypothetical protein
METCHPLQDKLKKVNCKLINMHNYVKMGNDGWKKLAKSWSKKKSNGLNGQIHDQLSFHTFPGMAHVLSSSILMPRL